MPSWHWVEGRLASLEPWAIASLTVRDQTERVYLYVSTIGGTSTVVRASAATSELIFAKTQGVCAPRGNGAKSHMAPGSTQKLLSTDKRRGLLASRGCAII